MKPDHEAAKLWAKAVIVGPDDFKPNRANAARAYLDLTQQLADARALLEKAISPEDDCAKVITDICAFLARTKGQNE